MMANKRRKDELEAARQMHQALVMHYIEGLPQKEVADILGVSHATANRLVKRGRAMGLVEIRIKSPVDHLIDIENALAALGGIRRAIVTPTVTDNPETALRDVGRMASSHLLASLSDGDTICITGGKGVSAVVEAMDDGGNRKVEVVPATGLVQGKHYTDVNHVAAQLAEKLGGEACQIHAPLFGETRQTRDMLLAMNPVKAVLDRARRADVAMVGIGSVLSDDSSYYDLHPETGADRAAIEDSGAVAELLAHLIGRHGELCDYELNETLVGLTLDELHKIPQRIGVAAGPNKAEPILTVLRGNHIDTLITDEATGIKVLSLAEQGENE